MKRFVALPLFATLLVSGPARAVALFGGGEPLMVQEDYVFLHHDEATQREHVLFAARVTPAFRRVQMGLPTPSSPTIEHVVVDLPDALHKLIAPRLMRENKRQPVPPAPWVPSSARFDSYVVTAASGDQIFDGAWTKSYVDKGFSIASFGVITTDDGRVEILSPTAHISFESKRLVLARREPALPIQPDDGLPDDLPDKPHSLVEVSVSKLEPKPLGMDVEAVARVLRSDPGRFLTCYEAYLERHPDTKWAQTFEATARPNGHSANIEAVEGQTDSAGKELSSCVQRVLQAKRTPRALDGYKFQTRVSFTPPHIPARRTHIVVLGSSKYVWPNQPASVRLEEDLEILPRDLRQALRDDVRRALGLGREERVWVSHWVDRSARRTRAEDIEFERHELPARGEPGALLLEKPEPEVPQIAQKSGQSTHSTHSTHSTYSRKKQTSLMLGGMLVVTLLVALWLSRSEISG